MALKNEKEMTLTHTLPDELIEEILLRLPVRSLLRFKCVCKSWLTLISNPQFAKSHYNIAAAPTHRLLVKPIDYFLRSVNIEASIHDDSALAYTAPQPLSLIPSVSFNYLRILGSCRGFILLRALRDDHLIIWNPSTGAHKTILPCSWSYKFLHGFGYDASTDDYLVIVVMALDLWIPHLVFFSLKTNSWNKIEGMYFPYLETHENFRAGLLLNGALHWFAFSILNEVVVMITFDLIKRNISQIPLPRDITRSVLEICHLVVIEGCLGLCCLGASIGHKDAMVFWVMKENNSHSSWTKSIVHYNNPCNSFSSICFTKGGGIVGSNACGNLMKLNDKGELLELSRYNVQLFRKSQLHFAMYTESLLSLPGDLGNAREDDQQ